MPLVEDLDILITDLRSQIEHAKGKIRESLKDIEQFQQTIARSRDMIERIQEQRDQLREPS